MKALTLATIFTAVDHMTGPIDKMGKSVTKYGRAASIAGKVGGTMLKAGAAIASASIVAGAAIGKAATAFAEKGDEIAKTARMLGLTTDALQELRYASGLQGVSDEQLTQGMKLLNNQLGQMQIGTGSLYTTLSATNPALAKQLKTVKSTDEAFTILMDAISRETNVQKRAALAQAAFGKSGQELIKMSNGGTEAIAALRGEAHKYGLVVDNSALLASEAFDDSLSRVKQSALGLANQGLGRIVEKLQPLLQRFADWIAANKEMLSMRVDQIFTTIERVAGALAPVFRALAPALEPLWNLVMALAPAFEATAKVIATILGPVVQLIGGIAQSLSDIMSGKVNAQSIRSGADTGGLMSEMGLSPVSPNTGMISSSSSVSRSLVDVNFAGLPSGATVKQSGAAPGFSLNVGRQMGGTQ